MVFFVVLLPGYKFYPPLWRGPGWLYSYVPVNPIIYGGEIAPLLFSYLLFMVVFLLPGHKWPGWLYSYIFINPIIYSGDIIILFSTHLLWYLTNYTPPHGLSEDPWHDILWLWTSYGYAFFFLHWGQWYSDTVFWMT